MVLPGHKAGYNLPDKAWFQWMAEQTKYTPDIAKLEQYAFQLYFACDETQEGQSQYKLIEDGAYVCPAFTQSSFNYWQPNIPWEPPIPMLSKEIIKPLPFYPDIAKIKGQVYAIRPKCFLELDKYKLNGVKYQRNRVRLLVPYRSLKFIKDLSNIPDDIEFVSPEGHVGRSVEKIVVIRAWMYTGIPEYWDKLISAFDYGSVQTYQSKNRAWCRTYYQVRGANRDTYSV